MIQRNPLVRQVRETQRLARLQTLTPADAAPATTSGETVGGMSSGGSWRSYGLLGITPLGAFTLKPSE